MLRNLLSTLVASSVILGTSSAVFAEPKRPADLKINQIQVLGTHNSYSLGVDPKLMELYDARVDAGIAMMTKGMDEAKLADWKEYHPNAVRWTEGLSYAYPEGLKGQLDAGLRSLEIDIYHDPDGGRFADPAAYRLPLEGGLDPNVLLPRNGADLEKPGFKVMHIADLDVRSSCNLFTACLQQLRAWSDAHPGHTPLFILIEVKDRGIPLVKNPTQVLPFDEAAFQALDSDILRIIGRNKIVTPDDVRGRYPTLEAAVLANQWPTLAASRGKFVFLMLTAADAGGLNSYTTGHPNLEGRVAFVRSRPGQPFAAFLLLDNATYRPGEVAERVKQGYLVRARADIETYEAKINDLSRANATLASGAQVVSTDFYKPGNAYGTPYVVKLPGGGDMRCNPVNARC